MNQYKFGDVVLLSFPLTNYNDVKKRPAMVFFDSGDDERVFNFTLY